MDKKDGLQIAQKNVGEEWDRPKLRTTVEGSQRIRQIVSIDVPKMGQLSGKTLDES